MRSSVGRVGLGVVGSVAVGLGIMSACSDSTTSRRSSVALTDRSVTPALIKNLMGGVQAFTLLSSDDVLPESPDFIFGGSTDGAGLLRNQTGNGYTLVVNNEDNFAVSRISFDSTFKPVKGEYIVTADHVKSRLCSGTMVTPEEHGFGPVFLTAGESGVESLNYTLNPFGTANSAVGRPALGHWTSENAVPLPKTAYPGKTVIVIGDDDSGPHGGQVALYVADAVGDLDGGRLYVLARTNDNIRERDMVVGQTYPVEFRQVPNQTLKTGAQINTEATALKSIQFGRVEDIDYRKDNAGRNVYIAITGQDNTGINADDSRSKYGRIYHLTLDPTDPTKGTIQVVLDGDDRNGVAKTFQNPDNIVVTKNFVYIQEDPNGYGDETHDSYLYQYNIGTKTLKTVFELDHRRNDPKYNVGGASTFGSWENSGMIDISDVVGKPGTFLVGIQAHTWRGPRYKGADGSVLRANEDQASQLIILSGLER